MENRKIAMLQPNYIPWKGVFDLINRVDVFVFYDDVQYTLKDWRNRNKIKTQNGDKWLSVPVKTKGLRDQLVCNAQINIQENWQRKHFSAIQSAYAKAPFFKEYKYLIEDIYMDNVWGSISDLDIYSTKKIAEAIGISAEWVNSSDLKLHGNKDGEKIIKICQELNCNFFINGPASKEFMDYEKFKEAGIELDYMDYIYPEYNQLYEPFNHYVTVLDVIFNCGPDAKKFICK
tara:strand:- start:407 stop:1102 length:696 start_codon:yes stop_codon:yes gene_type:complete